MRLFVDAHYFISVIIVQEGEYSCQMIELIHGMGMYPTYYDDKIQEDIVSGIVSNFSKNSVITNSLKEVFDFHKEILSELNNS